MKKAFIGLFAFILPISAFSSLNYNQANLPKLTKELCQQVDRLQQGSYHYFDCLNIAKEIQNKNSDLIKDTFKICSKSYIQEEDKCYSTLSKNFFAKKVKFSNWDYELETKFLSLVSKSIINKTIEELRYDEENADLYDAILSTFNLVDGWALNVMDASILLCSNVNLYSKLAINSNVDSKAKCYESTFELIESQSFFRN